MDNEDVEYLNALATGVILGFLFCFALVGVTVGF